MWKSWPFAGGVITLVVLCTAATLTAQNGSQFKDWKTTALGGAAQAKPRDEPPAAAPCYSQVSCVSAESPHDEPG